MSDESSRPWSSKLTRRDALKLGALAGVGASVAEQAANEITAVSAPSELNEKTIVELQVLMSKGELTAVGLLDFYLNRIGSLDQGGPRVNSIIELNPDARAIAEPSTRSGVRTDRAGRFMAFLSCSRTTSTPTTRCRRRRGRWRLSEFRHRCRIPWSRRSFVRRAR